MADFRVRKFSRAAATYHANADFQREMASRLIQILPMEERLERVLECGCGTGNLSELLRRRLPGARLLVTDQSLPMLVRCRERLGLQGMAYACLDARQGGASGPFDLVASGAMVQWFAEPGRHFALAARVLAPGGRLLCSGFLRGNFPELNDLLRSPPFRFEKFPGHDRDEVERDLAGAGLRLLDWQEEERGMVYPSVEDFFRRLRATGASGNAVSRLTPALLRELKERYLRQYGMPGGVRVTWRPWYLFAGRRDG